MPASHFPNGFMAGITIRGVPDHPIPPGQGVLGVQATPRGSWRASAAARTATRATSTRRSRTLDYAIGQCTANRGDVIFIKPGHAETISTATAVALDVAGIAIIGLGVGSNRPTFTLDTATTATIGVSAANVTLKNVIFTANFADIVSVFTTTTAKNFTVEDCYIKATATNMNFLNVVDTNATTNDTDGLALINNKWIEPDLATLGMVKMDGTNADVTIDNNYVERRRQQQQGHPDGHGHRQGGDPADPAGTGSIA
jgi:hypothetical protein